MAKVTGAELLRALRAEANLISGIADRLCRAVETVTDPIAAEPRWKLSARLPSSAPPPPISAAEADHWRAAAEAATEEMAVQMDALRLASARRRQPAPPPRPTATPMGPGGSPPLRLAGTPLSSRPAPRPASRYAPPRPTRDQALARAAQADQATGQAQQDAARAQAGEQAARAETGRVRADAYRDELAQLRVTTGHDPDTTSRTARRTRQAT